MQKAPETSIATDFKTHVLGHFFNQDQTLYNEKKNNNSGGAKDPNHIATTGVINSSNHLPTQGLWSGTVSDVYTSSKIFPPKKLSNKT